MNANQNAWTIRNLTQAERNHLTDILIKLRMKGAVKVEKPQAAKHETDAFGARIGSARAVFNAAVLELKGKKKKVDAESVAAIVGCKPAAANGHLKFLKTKGFIK